MTTTPRPPTKSDITMKKRCGKCRKEKVLNDFHRNSTTKYKRQSWCRLCMNAVMRKAMRARRRLMKEMRAKAMLDVAIEETSP